MLQIWTICRFRCWRLLRQVPGRDYRTRRHEIHRCARAHRIALQARRSRLGEKYSAVLREPELAARLAQNAFEESSRYRWASVREQWLKVYADLVVARRAKRKGLLATIAEPRSGTKEMISRGEQRDVESTTAEAARKKAPVFVLGCPRSGTTVLYHMLFRRAGSPYTGQSPTSSIFWRRDFAECVLQRPERAYGNLVEKQAISSLGIGCW